jgi:hypothetical protein
MAVHEVRIILSAQETACPKHTAMQPKEESGCRAATLATPCKHNAIPTNSQRARSRSQKEADHQARQLRAAESRLKRSAAASLIPYFKGLGRPISFTHRLTISLPAAKEVVLSGALEPPHEQLLARMAFAEQQQWITVQQKTFTKW